MPGEGAGGSVGAWWFGAGVPLGPPGLGVGPAGVGLVVGVGLVGVGLVGVGLVGLVVGVGRVGLGLVGVGLVVGLGWSVDLPVSS